MLVSNPACRKNTRDRAIKSRSLEAIYQDQRPSAVSPNDWSTVFDAFMSAWALNIVQNALSTMTESATHRAA